MIDGRDIPPIEDEPLMPPLHEVQAAAIFYYFPIGSDFEEYWDDIAKSSDGVTRAFAKKKAMKELLETIAPRAEQDLDAQLRAVYDWIGGDDRVQVVRFVLFGPDTFAAFGEALTRIAR